MKEENQEKKSKNYSILFLISGIFIGILITIFTGWIMMPKMMITVHKSRYKTVEETCDNLKKSIIANGWSCPAVRNLNKAMNKHGVTLDKKVRIVELCKANLAKEVLSTNPEVSTLMPCAWGVYKEKDGNVYISGMNMGIMGKIFGGNIAKVMGNNVATDEERILKNIIE